MPELPEHFEEVDEGTKESFVRNVSWDGADLIVNTVNIGTPRSKAYGDVKSWVGGIEYTNDDQIAILCNKDSGNRSDIIKYRKMQ